MITDITLLKVFSERSTYEQYLEHVQLDLLDYEIKTILLDFGKYFKEFDHAEISLSEFPTWFHHYRHPDLPESQHEVYTLIFKSLQAIDNTEVTQKIISHYQEKATAKEIRKVIDESFNIENLHSIIEQHEKLIGQVSNSQKEECVNNNLHDILSCTKRGDGLNWRLDCLNKEIGALSRGQFILVAAYVDVGKTIFAVSESTYMARQLTEGCVLWLNNEEDDLRVYRKIWKSVLGCDDEALEANPIRAEEEYKKRMHGDLGRIKFISIRNKGIREIAQLLEKYKPKLCVIDQVDKIENRKHKAFSDHDRLKNLYGEVRALANDYCPVMAVSQADVTTVKLDKDTGDIEYTLYPHHRQLDGSKVGKPWEADDIIMIGKRTGCENTRCLHVSKNKFGNMIKQEVIFSGKTARYENP